MTLMEQRLALIGTPPQAAQFMTPNGRLVRLWFRPGTSDWDTCNAITAIGNEYHMPTGLTGWGLDVGAHIGAAAVTFLLDNEAARMVAIEALPENVELIRRNLDENGVADRCVVLEGAAGDGTDQRIGYGERADPTRIHEYIGNVAFPEGSRTVDSRGVSLADAIAATDDAGFVWAKLDCENCEYPFLASPLVGSIAHIEGEFHGGWDRIVDLLVATHEVTGQGQDFGAFTAVRRG